MSKNEWKILQKTTAFKNKFREIEDWLVQNHQGKKANYFIRKGNDVAVVFAITEDQQVLILRQFFVSSMKRFVTLVAGMVPTGTDPLEIAKVELREEAGCEAKEWIELGSSLRGKWSTGELYFYIARGVEKKFSQDLEEAEDIDVEFISLADFKKILKNFKLQDATSVAGAYKALDYLGEL